MKCQLAALIFALIFASSLSAHQVHPCLALVAQLSQGAKQCELKQTQKGECDGVLQDLEGQVQFCKQQHFTQKAIDGAIEYGFAALEGDVSQSPYQRQVKQEQWEYQLMKPNLQAFERYFPDAVRISDVLTERFNASACPKQYLGDPDRYRYFGAQSLIRYSREQGQEDENPGHSGRYVYHWFAAERPGVCYDPDSSNGPDEKVVNIPGFFLDGLEEKDRVQVVRCKSNCLEEQAALAELYEQYNKQYRRHRQLLVCSDIDQRNEERRVVKGQRRSSIKLPDYCPDGEIQVETLNAGGLLDQLEQQLFLDVTLRTETAKSE